MALTGKTPGIRPFAPVKIAATNPCQRDQIDDFVVVPRIDCAA